MLDDFSATNNQPDAGMLFQYRNVLERVSMHRDQIGQRTWRDGSQPPVHLKKLGIDRGRLAQDFQRRADASAQREFA